MIYGKDNICHVGDSYALAVIALIASWINNHMCLFIFTTIMKITKDKNKFCTFYTAETNKTRVTIQADYVSYMKKLIYAINGERVTIDRKMIWLSYADDAPNKIIERMIKRLELEFNI